MKLLSRLAIASLFVATIYSMDANAACYSKVDGYYFAYSVDSDSRVLKITRVSHKPANGQEGCPTRILFGSGTAPLHWEDSERFVTKGQAESGRQAIREEYKDAGYRIEPVPLQRMW